ncbi:MAG: PilZ domain-containing protein [Planctomycetota bacterium]
MTVAALPGSAAKTPSRVRWRTWADQVIRQRESFSSGVIRQTGGVQPEARFCRFSGMSQENERRRTDRTRIAAFATLETKGVLNACNQALCSVLDVSMSGIGLETGQPPVVGQGVIMRLCLDDVVHELRTLATRVERRGSSNFYHVGLDWSSCSPEQLTFLDRVLAHFEKQPS